MFAYIYSLQVSITDYLKRTCKFQYHPGQIIVTVEIANQVRHLIMIKGGYDCVLFDYATLPNQRGHGVRYAINAIRACQAT